MPLYAQNLDLVNQVLVDDAKVDISFRYRLEHAEQDSFSEDASASTLRSTLSYKTGKLHDFSATLEFQNTTHLGDDKFNDTINGRSTYPTIADPEITEVNQVFVTYAGLPDTAISIGRKLINFDNRRMINVNNWRQHQQSFDSISLLNTSITDTVVNYVYVSNVNRSNGGDHPLGDIDSNLHLFNAQYNGWKHGALTAYSYFLDFEQVEFVGNSSLTYGLRFIGDTLINDTLNLLYTLEYAQQSDFADNPANYDADYILGELGLGSSNWSVKLGYEVLEADGANGRFTTPLGTGHGFHGWADQFVIIPSNGIEDRHIKAHYQIKAANQNFINGITFDVRYHDFKAEQGNIDYGDEIDIQVSKSFMESYSVAFIYANYNTDQYASDTQKAWLMLEAKL